jgi:hypothetical protein
MLCCPLSIRVLELPITRSQTRHDSIKCCLDLLDRLAQADVSIERVSTETSGFRNSYIATETWCFPTMTQKSGLSERPAVVIDFD